MLKKISYTGIHCNLVPFFSRNNYVFGGVCRGTHTVASNLCSLGCTVIYILSPLLIDFSVCTEERISCQRTCWDITRPCFCHACDDDHDDDII